MHDATLRDKGQYRFYLYDKLERTVVQGLCNGYNRSEKMNIAELKENIGGLCNTDYNIPLSDKITNPNLETVNYYDNYTFLQKYSAELECLVSDFQVKGSCEQGDTGGYSTFDKEENDLPIFHYYTQDHLGNNRIVTNEDGTVEQIVHYYPFGGTFNDAGVNASLQQYKYNGKDLDRVAGLNTYGYGARQYFSALPVWDRVDPECEKYYNISPYAYCANNPIILKDYKGEKIIYAWGTSISFKIALYEVIGYLSSHSCDNLYNILEKSSEIFMMQETNGSIGNSFSYKDGIIEWNPLRGLDTGLTILSPAVLLNHEFAHAVNWLNSPDDFSDNIKVLTDDSPDVDYHTKEDKNVINTVERDTAVKLGEIKKGEITRIGHGGTPVKTVSPIFQIKHLMKY